MAPEAIAQPKLLNPKAAAARRENSPQKSLDLAVYVKVPWFGIGIWVRFEAEHSSSSDTRAEVE